MTEQPRRFLIIGANAAGMKAASKARRCDPDLEITVLERTGTISYAGCGLPYYVEGVVSRRDELVSTPVGSVRTPAFFEHLKNIKVLTEHEATVIERDTKTVLARDLRNDEERTFHYDVLLIATGTSPLWIPIAGADLAGVHGLKRVEDADAIKAEVDSGRVSRAVIIGGGYIGVEMAEALVTRGVETTMVEALDQILAPFDPPMAALVTNHMRQKGVAIRLNERVERLEGEAGRVTGVVTDAGRIETDLVVVGIGVRPNVELAAAAGLTIGRTGAIAVDKHLRTSDPRIYAAGDCVENVDLITGEKVFVPLGSTANKHGRVVGVNVTGGHDTFPGIVGTVILKAFDFSAGRTGLSEKDAQARGMDVTAVSTAGPDRAHYYPGAAPLVIKLVADRSSGELLGGQVVGPGDAARRVDVLATAITAGTSVKDLSTMDLAYAPPFAPVLDPVITAANVLLNKLEDPSISLTPREVKDRLDAGQDFVLLDVRTPQEYEEVRIPGAVLLPIGELRGRLDDLPRDKEIVTFCKISLRGWDAVTLLRGAGFQDVKFMEAGVLGWPYELERGPAT